ncbi:unnamed protein product [Lactuca saligna]|uniref:Uncharacterized protein n=1 Tax=Lactuca saligna TaxID=75948 RepID=A0AA35VF99_LACSI|nr:unnamed protein product [Lactuca saligna]
MDNNKSKANNPKLANIYFYTTMDVLLITHLDRIRIWWCRRSTVAATVGGDGSFVASTSCSVELDEDGGKLRWVRRREEVAVDGRGWKALVASLSSSFSGQQVVEREVVGDGMRFDVVWW